MDAKGATLSPPAPDELSRNAATLDLAKWAAPAIGPTSGKATPEGRS